MVVNDIIYHIILDVCANSNGGLNGLFAKMYVYITEIPYGQKISLVGVAN